MLTYSYLTNNSITIYYESDLPIKGWIQSCIFCDQCTSRIKTLINYYNYKINFHVCKDCQDFNINQLNDYYKIKKFYKKILCYTTYYDKNKYY